METEPTEFNNPPRVGSFARTSTGLSDYQVKMVFIMPTMILLILMNIFPLLWSLVLSFYKYRVNRPDLPPEFIGFKNYVRLLSDPDMWGYFQTTAYFVVTAVSAQFLIGFGVALLLNREFRYKGLVTTLILLPMMLSPVIVGLFWRFLFKSDTSGLINYFLLPLLNFVQATPIPWTTDPKFAMVSIVIVDTWMWTPFMMLISLAGLSAIPKYLYEAADVDRASNWFKFRWITLPLVSPLLMIAILFRTMDAFKMFDIVYVLTREGGPGTATETVSMNLYKLAFRSFNTGKSCAMAYILLIVIVALSNIYVKYLNQLKREA
ncbi:MAG: sugar ABC transporter permease [Candidatus Poribacteria bacterium]|jgi:multiple sugar transport system permease protein|nr:sugar ABC transporter permease [Candidatus Poribacteria bacterium]